MHMSRLVVAVSLAAIAYVATPFAQSPWLDAYREPAGRLIAEGTSTSFAWDRLAELGDTFGHRLSGSENLDAAIKWAASEMRRDGLDVRLDPVKVPHWVRGAESLEIVAPGSHPLTMQGLGNAWVRRSTSLVRKEELAQCCGVLDWETGTALRPGSWK